MIKGFVQPSLGFRCTSRSILDIDNLSLCENFELDIFDTGGPQCHFEWLTLIFQTKFSFS